MKPTSKLLVTILLLGLLFSLFKLFNGRGGSGLGDFIDSIGYTSLILFITSFIILILNIRRIKRHIDTFIFLLLGLPMTIMAAKGYIQNTNYNRIADLTPQYPRPVSAPVFIADSLTISTQIDSLIALKNRNTGGTKIAYGSIDTILYSQSGNEIFIVYANKFEPNDLGNDLYPAYLSADKRDSVYWHLKEGPPNASTMTGSFHDLKELKKEVRKFYFNQYSFLEADSMQKNYFWKRKVH